MSARRRPSSAEGRLSRALARGAILIVEDGIGRVSPGGDLRRRALGVFSAEATTALLSSGRLTPIAGAADRYALIDSGRAAQRGVVPAPPPPTPRARAQRRSVFALALEDTEAREARRLASAASRFAADIERAAASDLATMRWDAVPAARSGRNGGDRPLNAVAAQGRLRRLQSALGGETMSALQAIILDRASRRRVTERFALRSPKDAVAWAANHLRALADAYDRVLPPDRAAS